jgi:ribonuclease HI
VANTKYYVVWVGRKPGIYTSWPECQKQVIKFKDAKFKSFESKAEADKAFAGGWQGLWGQASAAKASPKRSAPAKTASFDDIDYDSISVDVGTNGNPGPVEYKGVDTRTGEIVFSCGPIRKGTNNLGEFLAIVHALSYLKEIGSGKTVYTDSMNALKWVNQKAVSSTLVRDASTKEIWELVDRAEQWLRTNSYENKILKWQTRVWGEIKADYGRK